MSEENAAVESQGAPTITVEDEARAQGWVDKTEFRGSEDDWVDAETFVKRGKEILPVLKKNNEKLLQRLAKAEKDAEEARQAAKEFREFQKQTFERKTKELELQISDLRQQKKEAISQGDGERVVEIDDVIDSLKEEQKAAKAEATRVEPAVQPTVDPVLNTWMEKNEWFGKDRKLTGLANGIGEEIRATNPNLVGEAFLEELDRQMADYLGKTKTAPASPVEGRSTTRPASGKKKSYENLPSEAKAACDRFVKQGLMTKEQYVADFDWE